MMSNLNELCKGTRALKWRAVVLERSIPEPMSGCWLWFGSVSASGYGIVEINKRINRVTRLSYAAFKGPFDQSLLMCHKCDNTHCVNPDHLFPGTSLDNTRDAQRKGRRKTGLTCSRHPGPLRTSPAGRKYCPECARERYARKKLANAVAALGGSP